MARIHGVSVSSLSDQARSSVIFSVTFKPHSKNDSLNHKHTRWLRGVWVPTLLQNERRESRSHAWRVSPYTQRFSHFLKLASLILKNPPFLSLKAGYC